MSVSTTSPGLHQDTRTTGALTPERILFMQLALFMMVRLIAPTVTIYQATTSASTSQLFLRVAPILAISGLALLPSLVLPARSRFIFRAPVFPWIVFCLFAALGALTLGMYPRSFSLWKSAEMCLPILAIASSTSRMTFEAAQRTVIRLLELLLVALAVSVIIRPSGLKPLGGLVQLNSDLIGYSPNKLAISAAIYLILVVHVDLSNKRWRIALGAAMVVLALSRSVLVILFIGAPYFFARVQSGGRQSLRTRIQLMLVLIPAAIIGNRIVTSVVTKGGTVSNRNIASVSGRTFKWEKALDLLQEWPWGWGINGAFRELTVEELQEPLGNVHSSAIEAFLAAGILGGVFWVLFWIYPLRHVRSIPLADRVTFTGANRAIAFMLVASLVDSGFVLFTMNFMLAATLVVANRPRKRASQDAQLVNSQSPH